MSGIVGCDVVASDGYSGKGIATAIYHCVAGGSVVIVCSDKVAGLLNIPNDARPRLLRIHKAVFRKGLRGMQKLHVHEEERLILENGSAHAESWNVLDELRSRQLIL